MPWVVTRAKSSYVLAIVSPASDPRNRAYVASVSDAPCDNISWRDIAPSYDDQLMDPALHGDVLYWHWSKNAPRGRILALDLSRPGAKLRGVAVEGNLPISDVYAGHDTLYWRVSDAHNN
jgi:hypothetical protein